MDPLPITKEQLIEMLNEVDPKSRIKLDLTKASGLSGYIERIKPCTDKRAVVELEVVS